MFKPSQALTEIYDAFVAHGFEVRIVGGAVRDMLMGVEPKDIDLCTNAIPAEMEVIANEFGFTFVPTGIQHGTVTLVNQHEPFEITTLRIDTDTDGRHAQVQFTRSFSEDAARRDLTINAMNMTFDGKIFDYFNGIADLVNREVRFVGDPMERITEDYLRILRYFRFAARFNAKMDDDTISCFMDQKVRLGLQKISRERYWLEMQKLMVMPGAPEVMQVMESSGILTTIGMEPMNYPLLARAKCAEQAIAFMFLNKPDRARQFCNEWKMSNEEISQIVWLVDHHDMIRGDGSDATTILDWVVEKVNPQWIINVCDMHQAPMSAAYAASFRDGWQAPVFPVTGNDLFALGFSQGKEMGQKLKDLKEAWKSSRYEMTKEELLKIQ